MLRKNTGHQRMDNCGGAQTDELTCCLRIMRSP
jgi:hypothetical protein